MARLRFITFFGLAFLFAALAAVFIRVLEIRFSTGEVYPHYSTLRSDPLGSMAFYEAMVALDGIEVSRNFENLMTLDTLDGDTTLFLCGLGRQSFERLRAPEDSPVLQAVKNDGARLVIAINPQLVPAKFDLENKEENEWLKKREELRKKREAAGEEEKDGDGQATEEEPEAESDQLREEFELEWEEQSGPRLTKLLDIGISSPNSFERPESGWPLEPGENAPGVLPLWYSQFRFTDPGEDWTVVAQVEGEPVVVERAFGEGDIVLTTDAYFASNEALWLGAEAPFLLWLGGGKPKLIFDETIHGSTETTGVVKLLQEFRLHGFFFGLLVFVILLAWKSGTSLTSGNESIERGLVGSDGAVAGEESDSGLVRLLRRSIRPKELLAQCLQVYRGATAQEGNGSAIHREHSGQAAAIDRVIGQDQVQTGGAVAAYRQITRILSQPDAYRRESRKAPAETSFGSPPPPPRD